MNRMVCRYFGRTIHTIRADEPFPRRIDLGQFVRIRGVLCRVIGLTPEDDEQTLAVDVLTCSNAYVLKESLPMTPPGPSAVTPAPPPAR